jgi:DNA polymerase-3 subunit epsilon
MEREFSRRRVFLDTETTGLSPCLGHRVVEIGCVESCGGRLTGRRFHRYLNPEREIDAGAFAVHGITQELLRDKPHFADVAGEFLDFIRGAEVVIHNAPFDLGFLNAELARQNMPPAEAACRSVVDSLRLARERHPGQKNSLDALCERYGVDGSKRLLHGALLDAEMLAEVFLAMTREQEIPALGEIEADRPPGYVKLG